MIDGGLLGSFDRCFYCDRIMSIDIGNHVPAISFKPLGCIICEPAFHMSINGNAVVVVEADQLA